MSSGPWFAIYNLVKNGAWWRGPDNVLLLNKAVVNLRCQHSEMQTDHIRVSPSRPCVVQLKVVGAASHTIRKHRLVVAHCLVLSFSFRFPFFFLSLFPFFFFFWSGFFFLCTHKLSNANCEEKFALAIQYHLQATYSIVNSHYFFESSTWLHNCVFVSYLLYIPSNRVLATKSVSGSFLVISSS